MGTGVRACALASGSSTVTLSFFCSGWSERVSERISLMCSGVVPQQPPMILTPAHSRRRAYCAMYSGEQRYMLRPSTRVGSPALGMALMGLEENCIIRSMVSSVALGPTEQLRPMASTGQESISRVKVSVSVPPGRCPKSSMVTWATMATSPPAASCAARTASRSSSRLPKVSRISRSTPASTSASICSRKMARASAKEVGPSGSMRTPSGPTAPATNGRFLGRFARQAHAGLVDVRQLLGHSEPRQPHAVGAEGVGFDDFSAGLDVVLVDLADQVGRREIQLIEAAVDEDAAGVEHGAHGAVRHQDAAGQLLAEFLGAVVGGGGHGKLARAVLGPGVAIFVILPRTGQASHGSAGVRTRNFGVC